MWELRVLEAKESLYEGQLKLAEIELAEAKKQCSVDSDHALKLSCVELKINCGKTEYSLANAQLDLALKRCSVADGDEKARLQARVLHCEQRLQVATENLRWSNDEKKEILKMICDSSYPTQQLDHAAAGPKRKGSVSGNAGIVKKTRASLLSLSQGNEIPAWQWRHTDGTWMNYGQTESSMIDDAQNRRESTCRITIDGVEFVVDLVKLEQRRAKSNSEASASSGTPTQDAFRPIRRWQEEWNEDSMLLWNAHIREVYPSWDDQTAEVQVCAVEQGTNDYRKVKQLLFDGSGRLSDEMHEICRVLRIQNVWTLSRYENEKKALSRKRNGGAN